MAMSSFFHFFMSRDPVVVVQAVEVSAECTVPRSNRANPVQKDTLVPSNVSAGFGPERHGIKVRPCISTILTAGVGSAAVDNRRPYVQQCSPRQVNIVDLLVGHLRTGVTKCSQADRIRQRYRADGGFAGERVAYDR